MLHFHIGADLNKFSGVRACVCAHLQPQLLFVIHYVRPPPALTRYARAHTLCPLLLLPQTLQHENQRLLASKLASGKQLDAASRAKEGLQAELAAARKVGSISQVNVVRE
jgi:hypothetical protein